MTNLSITFEKFCSFSQAQSMLSTLGFGLE